MTFSTSNMQKGALGEARIIELITLNPKSSLVCYQPVADDEGIDLIVRKRGGLEALCIQVKSRFMQDPSKFQTRVKKKTLINNKQLALVFCMYDIRHASWADFLLFVPAPDFVRLATKQNNGQNYSIVASATNLDHGKWAPYRVSPFELPMRIQSYLKQI